MSKIVTIPSYMNPFQATVNGISYRYDPGTTVEVPDAVAAIIENQIALNKEPKQEEELTAKVGQIRVVAEVDENGKPTAWKYVDLPSGDSGVVIATFNYLPNYSAWQCLSHTAPQIQSLLADGKPVMAHMVDREGNYTWNMWMGMNNGVLCIFDCVINDIGFSHRFGEIGFYVDGDNYNQEIGNELWMEL